MDWGFIIVGGIVALFVIGIVVGSFKAAVMWSTGMTDTLAVLNKLAEDTTKQQKKMDEAIYLQRRAAFNTILSLRGLIASSEISNKELKKLNANIIYLTRTLQSSLEVDDTFIDEVEIEEGTKAEEAIDDVKRITNGWLRHFIDNDSVYDSMGRDLDLFDKLEKFIDDDMLERNLED